MHIIVGLIRTMAEKRDGIRRGTFFRAGMKNDGHGWEMDFVV
jgi:hypothetical protein